MLYQYHDPLLLEVLVKDLRIAVVGLGYVGLPLLIGLKKAGFRNLVGVDVDEGKIADIRAGGRQGYDSFGRDEDMQAYVRGVQSTPVSTPAELDPVDIAIICVPTPLEKGSTYPDHSYVLAAVESMASKANLIILESTVAPGFTESLQDMYPLVKFAFAPERVSPGTGRDPKECAKVVSATDPVALVAVQALYGELHEEVHAASSTTVAELTKLLENCFRAVNIAFANEFADLARYTGVDPREVVELASTKPWGFMPFWPSAGPGGHCIPVDPFFALSAAPGRSLMRVLHQAVASNRDRVHQIAEIVLAAFDARPEEFAEKNILIAGMGYKPGVDDRRESRGEALAEILRNKGLPVATLEFGDRDLHERIGDAAVIVDMHGQVIGFDEPGWPAKVDCTA